MPSITWKDIRFGFIRGIPDALLHRTVPLKRGEYIVRALMPMLLLGILPLSQDCWEDGGFRCCWGRHDGCRGGDLLIVWDLLRYRSGREEIVYMDHPTQAGGVIFQR